MHRHHCRIIPWMIMRFLLICLTTIFVVWLQHVIHWLL